MTDSQTWSESPRPEPVVDVARLKAMTEDMIASMRAVRDLTAARGKAQAEYGDVLGEHQVRLNQESDNLNRREIELDDKSAALERERTETEAGAQQAGQRLADERELLSRRAETLAERESGLTAAGDDVQAQRARIEISSGELADVERRSAERKGRLNEREERLTASEQVLQEREASISACEDRQAVAEREFTEKSAELLAQRQRLEVTTAELDQRGATLTLQEAQLECEREELALSMAALDKKRSEIDRNRRAALAQLETLAAREAELAIRESQSSNVPSTASAACEESDAAIPGTHVEVRQCEQLALYESIDRAATAAGGRVPYVAHRTRQREWLVVVRADDLPRLADCVVLMSSRDHAEDGVEQTA